MRISACVIAIMLSGAVCFAVLYSVDTYDEVTAFNSMPDVWQPVDFWERLLPW